MFHLVRVALGLVATLALLTGCSALTSTTPTTSPAASAPQGGSDQSVAGACESLGSAMGEAADTFQSALGELGTDPQQALSALQEFATSLKDAAATVQNPQVKAQVDKAIAALNDLTAALEAGIKDPLKMTEVLGTISAVQEELTAIGTVCAG